MSLDEDSVVLTDREREVLANLAATLDDPWLAQQLLGGDARPSAELELAVLEEARPSRRRLRLLHWAGIALIVLGALTYLATFRLWEAIGRIGAVAGVSGIGVMAAGVALLWRERTALRRHTGAPGTSANP